MGTRRTQFTSFLFTAATISYGGSLQHFTLDPIREIAENQTDIGRVKLLLQAYKTRKSQEIHFVRQAATLSAAAVIGCFSWPQTASSYWIGQLFWQASLWLSIFALTRINCGNLLLLLLRPASIAQRDPGVNPLLEPDPKMVWVWQTPLMLMSLSWVSFLVGYELYILTPCIQGKTWTIESTSSILATAVGLLVITNFCFNALLAQSMVKEMELEDIASTSEAEQPPGERQRDIT